MSIYTLITASKAAGGSLKERYTLRNLTGKSHYFLSEITEMLKYKIHSQASIWFPVVVVVITVKEIKERQIERDRHIPCS